ncbi:hypothetical protein SH668x_001106 [Planctomicrobium sp. SH668]|uniref:hypothetical protein n=1 Tax=Planctomicrobium sp. SH668 TaxID=3448126 RepID=UPI003F5AFD8E
MNFDHQILAFCLGFSLIGVVGPSSVQGGCPCQKGAQAMPVETLAPTPEYAGAGFVPPVSMPGVAPMTPVYGSANAPPIGLMQPGVGPGYSAATATTWQPPPGTIGQTYQMRSRPVPVKMHPRAALVDVRIPGAKNVRVHDMNVYRTQDFLEGFQDDQDSDVWHFTSEPLIPGLAHIYRIEARINGPEGEKVEERYVRLIMGRVIEVSF